MCVLLRCEVVLTTLKSEFLVIAVSLRWRSNDNDTLTDNDNDNDTLTGSRTEMEKCTFIFQSRDNFDKRSIHCPDKFTM